LTEPILGNFVQLSEGIPKRLRFSDHTITAKAIMDPMTKTMKTVNALQFRVIEEDGIPVDKIYSITSEKHAQQFAPFLQDKTYIGRVFTIIVRGRGFLREYTTQVS